MATLSSESPQADPVQAELDAEIESLEVESMSSYYSK